MYEDDLQLSELKENSLPLKLYRKLRKMFLSPRRESNPQPSDLRCPQPSEQVHIVAFSLPSESW